MIACHISCKLECLGPGASGCVECRSGYSKENNTCTGQSTKLHSSLSARISVETFFVLISDVDECSGESNPCDSETETCQNLLGSYVCKCLEGLVKSSDGKCVTEVEIPPNDKPKPKKTKKKKRVKKGNTGSTDKSSEKPHYPWYYIIGPLTVLYLVKRFCQPNIVTSAGLILILVITATLSP